MELDEAVSAEVEVAQSGVSVEDVNLQEPPHQCEALTRNTRNFPSPMKPSESQPSPSSLG